jgi:regulator of sigma E protease
MITFLVFAGSILVLVGVHEAGHFFAARAFGVYIKEFAVGFGPRLVRFRGKETEYSLRIIPFGGYVKMAGEDRLESGSEIPTDRLLYNKPPYARMLISLAGPFTNLALALVLTLLVVWTIAFPILQVSEIVPDTPAAATLQFGDRILEIDGRRILMRDQITTAVNASEGDPVDVYLERDGQATRISIQPQYVEDEARYVLGAYFSMTAITNELVALAPSSPLTQAGAKPGDRIVAVAGTPTDTLVSIQLAAADALPATELIVSVQREGAVLDLTVPAADRTTDALFSGAVFADLGVSYRRARFLEGSALAIRQFAGYVQALVEVIQSVVTGRVAAGDVFQGPVGVAQLLGEGIRVGASFFFQLLAFLSLNFGLINLVPFPALDGSRAAFSLVEWIRGKPIPPEREGIIHAIGFFVLIGLMLLITYRDILRLFR